MEDEEATRLNAPVSCQAPSNVERSVFVAGKLVQHVQKGRHVDKGIIIGLHDESCVIVRHRMLEHEVHLCRQQAVPMRLCLPAEFLN